MSLNLVCAVLDRGPANLAEMAVLLAIADSADKDTGEAWPSQVTIARRARQTDRSVRKVLERLRLGGWLSWETRRRANGSQASNVYTLNLVKLGEAREKVTAQPEPRSVIRRNHVPPPPEPRSTHAPEPRSALEPSQKKEPCTVRGADRNAGRSSAVRGSGSFSVSVCEGVGPDLSGLTAFQRSRVFADQSIYIGDVLQVPGSPQFEALRLALRGASAENRGAL